MAANTANTSPIFTNKGDFLPIRLTYSNPASDGTGTVSVLVTAGVDGTRVDGVRFRNSQPTYSVSSAMVHRIYLSGTAGTNFRLIGEVATAAATRSASAVGATSLFTFDQPIIMQSGQLLGVNQSVYIGTQDQFDAVAYSSDY